MRVPLLNVDLVPAPDQVVVRLRGEADLASAEQLTDALHQAAAIGTATVVVDVAAATFWDCSGLHALADFTTDLARAGRQCRIVGATPATRRLVVLADFTPSLVLDGPVHLPAVATAGASLPERPSPAASPAPSDPRADRLVAAEEAAAAAERRRARVPGHAAPARRGLVAAGTARGALATVRLWR